MLRLLCQGVARLRLAQHGQQGPGGQGLHIVLNRRHAGHVMLAACRQQLLYALVAVRQAPVLGQKMRIAGIRHALVGRGHKAARAAIVLRRLLVAQPALPVIARIPAGRRRHAAQVIAGRTHRHPACGLEADMSLHIGRHNALHGRVVDGECLEQFGHSLRPVGPEAGLHRAVVRIQRRPAQGQRIAIGVDDLAILLLRVADHRAVARAAQRHPDIALALDLEDFLAHDKLFPARGRAVLAGIGRVDLLQIQILHIGVGVGKAPGHLRRAAQHHKGHAGQGGPCHIQLAQGTAVTGPALWRLKTREVPDGRSAQPQMRIVGQQGLAASGLAAGHHPVIAAQSVIRAHILRHGGRPLL